MRAALFFCPVALLVSTAFASAQSSPSRFYQDLSKSVKVLQGNMYLNLNAGTWKTKLPAGGPPLVVRIAPNTLVQTTVDYQAGVLNSASMTFQPAIHIWIKDPHNGFSGAVDSISFDNLGDATPHFVLPLDNGATANPNLVQSLSRGLRLDRSPSGILLGNPFSSLGPTQPCSNTNATTCGDAAPLITEVRFEKLDDTHPGLHVELNAGSTLHFSSKDAGGKTFDNTVKLANGSSFTFSQIDYTTDNRVLFARLDDFKVNVDSGILNTKDVSLVLSPGSILQFQQVDLNKNGAVASIDARSGSLDALVGTGSSINLSTGVPNSSSIIFANNSKIDLQGFSLGIDDSRKTMFSVGGGSTLSAQVASGRIGVGSTGFLSLAGGTLNGNLVGTWDSAAEDGPQAILDISLLEVQVDGGVLDLNQDSHVKIVSGNLKAHDLTFRGSEFSGLVGTVPTLNLVIQEGSRLGIPGGLQVVTGSGVATLTAATPADPLVFSVGSNFPTGMVTLALPFTELRDSKLDTFLVRNGSIKLNIANRSNGSIDGKDGSFQGTGVFSSKDLALTAHFVVSQLSVAKDPGKTPVIQGTFTGSMDKVDIVYSSTPIYHTPGHDKLRIYPVTVELKMLSDLTLPASLLQFDATGFSLTSLTHGTVDIPLSAQLIVPTGCGEHQQPDDNNDFPDGCAQHGPDEDKQRQEVVTDTFEDFRAHIYVIAATYQATATLHVLANSSTISVALDSLHTDNPIGWAKDGIDLNKLLPIIGSIVGTVFAGPAGTPLGIAAGLVAGGDLDNMVTARINAVILEKTQGLQGSWRFQL